MVTVRAKPGARTHAPDDTELARRATAGDREAFGLLFERWFDRAYDGSAAGCCGSPATGG
jgi:hypothetical protein